MVGSQDHLSSAEGASVCVGGLPTALGSDSQEKQFRVQCGVLPREEGMSVYGVADRAE